MHHSDVSRRENACLRHFSVLQRCPPHSLREFVVTRLSYSKTRQGARLDQPPIALHGEIVMRRATLLLSASLFTLAASAASAQNATPHNLILFVPDGLRALKVTPQTAPAMAEVRDKGVNF